MSSFVSLFTGGGVKRVAAPPPPARPPSLAEEERKRRARLRGFGQAGTVKTSPLGVQGGLETEKATLLGG